MIISILSFAFKVAVKPLWCFVYKYIFLNKERWRISWRNCSNKYLHCNYVPAHSMLTRYLPKSYRNNEVAECIRCLINLTGLIKSVNGSGCVQRIRRRSGHCPCGYCPPELNTEFAIITITTVNHAIKDINNVKLFTFVLDFNRKTQRVEDCVQLQGLRHLATDREVSEDMDWCAVEFVTHNMDVVRKLEDNLNKYQKLQETLYEKYKNRLSKLVVIVGHPHGGPKKVSFGEIRGDNGKETLKEIRDRQNWCRYEYNAVTCPGSSGSPILIPGQPLCGFGYWFGHPHNHAAGKDMIFRVSRSSVGVDHTVESIIRNNTTEKNECEVQITRGKSSLHQAKKSCDKKHIHGNFISLADLTIRLLPLNFQNKQVLGYIKCISTLTGLIQIDLNDGSKIYASGFIKDMYGLRDGEVRVTILSIMSCVLSINMTERATLFLDYNKKDRSSTLIQKELNAADIKDHCISMHFHTEDRKTISCLENALKHRSQSLKVETKFSNFVAMIGHTHGGPKTICFGSVESGVIKIPTCPGNSGSPIIIFRENPTILLHSCGNPTTTGVHTYFNLQQL